MARISAIAPPLFSGKIIGLNRMNVLQEKRNPSEALARLRQNESDLVLMGVQMSEIDEFEALEIIRQNKKNTDLCATAFLYATFNCTRDRYLQAGIDG